MYLPFICFAIWNPIEISTCFDLWKRTSASCDIYPWHKRSCYGMGCVVMSENANDYCEILSGNVNAIATVIAIVILIWILIANGTTEEHQECQTCINSRFRVMVSGQRISIVAVRRTSHPVSGRSRPMFAAFSRPQSVQRETQSRCEVLYAVTTTRSVCHKREPKANLARQCRVATHISHACAVCSAATPINNGQYYVDHFTTSFFMFVKNIFSFSFNY
ncbi:hypothetical protein ALC57_17966 [Trachymyrmex cornetzi]|uniref:Uncharacterized protein n=1 Tax=Trachymyrmex cornetzi TaxID=471704 RepID=A0A151ISN1_9HYME|nr:hypothetical protein ALC57_17966 [Trachymyrmex cornetzi]